jgi:hypothetical protein
MFRQEAANSLPRFLILFEGIAAMVRARDCIELVRHLGRIESFMQAHRLGIRNKRILVSGES